MQECCILSHRRSRAAGLLHMVNEGMMHCEFIMKEECILRNLPKVDCLRNETSNEKQPCNHLENNS